MGLIARLFNFTAGTTVDSAQVNAEFNQILGLLNGNVDSANLKDGSVDVVDLTVAAKNNFLKLAAAADVKASFGNFTLGFTGTGVPSVSGNIAHGLGAVPARILIAQRASTGDAVFGVAYAKTKDGTNFVANGVALFSSVAPNFNIDFDFLALSA